MKKLFFIAVSIIMVAAISLVAYGAFLNYRSEHLISLRMSNRVLKLEGAQADWRPLRVTLEKESVRLSAEHMTDAIAQVEGTIEEVFFKQNEPIRKGQVICRIVNHDIGIKLAQTDVNIAKAETIFSRYKTSYDRYKRLVNLGAVSQEKYEEVLTNYQTAGEEVKQLRLERRQYELIQDRLLIKSPLDGEVLFLYKKVGSFVANGSSVALVGDFSTLRFTETISDNDLSALLPLGTEWQFQISRSDWEKIYATGYKKNNRGVEQLFEAKIVGVEPPLTVPAALRTIHWEISNTSGSLEPKRYLDVRILAATERKVLAIPKDALIDSKSKSVYVWSQPEGVLELRSIETGATDGQYVEVMSGLTQGDIVVVSGKEGLSNGLKVELGLKGGATNVQ